MDSNKDKKKPKKQQQLDSQRRCDAINLGAAHAKLRVSTRDESTEAFQEAHFLVFFAERRCVNIKASSVSQNTHRGSLGGVQRKEGAASVCSSVAEVTVVSTI